MQAHCSPWRWRSSLRPQEKLPREPLASHLSRFSHVTLSLNFASSDIINSHSLANWAKKALTPRKQRARSTSTLLLPSRFALWMQRSKTFPEKNTNYAQIIWENLNWVRELELFGEVSYCLRKQLQYLYWFWRKEREDPAARRFNAAT